MQIHLMALNCTLKMVKTGNFVVRIWLQEKYPQAYTSKSYPPTEKKIMHADRVGLFPGMQVWKAISIMYYINK